MGPGQLYQDLQNLIHDLSLVNQISHMIGSLKGNYQVRIIKKMFCMIIINTKKLL